MSTANEQQVANWNGESGLRWVADADRRDRILAPVGDVLLEAAALAPGEAVLDVGCGCGATTIAAGRAVAPGSVTGVDLSEPMLELASRRASGSGIAFVAADAQTHGFGPERYDVIISRFGTMFFDDPGAAFANLAAASTGRLCIVTWQPLEANEWLALPGAALSRFGDLSDMSPLTPGMFAQSDPASVGNVLRAAGWGDVTIDPVDLELPIGTDAADAADYVTATGVVRAVLDPLSDGDRAEAIAAVTAALTPRETATGVRLGAGILVVRATALSGAG